MFLFKKIVSQCFFPLTFCLGPCFLGLVFLWFTRRQKAGKILVTCGVGLLTLLSYDPVANALLGPLERRFDAYKPGSARAPKYVVVLGGGHHSDPRLPATSQIGDETLKRLLEGIRIHRATPGSKLVLSGGSWLDPVPDARVMAEVAKAIGVKESDIIVEDKSKDTRDEAVLLKTLLGTNPFVLVTSAAHLPRSMAFFRKEGMEPIPAAADHLAVSEPISPGSFFPQAGALRKSERAVYEYLGSAWARLRGEL
jgi:uncharacterized SAM-binding protein YcdF (DUF218 family)